MSFEFKIRQKLELKEPHFQTVETQEILNSLQHHLIDKEHIEAKAVNEKISFQSNHSVLYYNYQAEFEVIRNRESTWVVFEYSLIPVFKITVIMILFAAFFSRFSINNLLIFSGVFIVVFFTFNILYINAALKNIVISALWPEQKNSEEILSREQKEWIKNPRKCPACGEEISDYHYICPECELSVNPKNRTKNINVSDFYDLKFRYVFEGEKVKGEKVKGEKVKGEKRKSKKSKNQETRL